jgi:hypothetical protein
MAAILQVQTKFTGTSVLITAKTDELAESELIFNESINLSRFGSDSNAHRYLVTALTKNTTYTYVIRFRFASIGQEISGSVTTNNSDEILRLDGTSYLPNGNEGPGTGIGTGGVTPPETNIGPAPTFLSVDFYSQLPAATLNNNKLFLVLKEENTGVNTKYGGFYRSNGVVWEFLGPSTQDIIGLAQLQLTEHKSYDSEVTPDQVGKGGYFGGYFYFAHTVGEEGSGKSQWARVSIANKGF